MAERRIGVVGAGYVGLTTAACLAHLGNDVVCVDTSAAKVRALSAGKVGIREPGLDDLVRCGVRGGRLRFRTTVESLADRAIVYLCVPTPAADSGTADLMILDHVVTRLAGLLAPDATVVIKSTVPAGTAEEVTVRLGRPDIAVVSNPEFLREGHAVVDFLRPDRIVIGSSNSRGADTVADLYADIDAPVLHTDWPSAELTKYACNGFLSVKASYVNELALLCEQVGADIGAVTGAMGLDPRIGREYLSPGCGWGGSCLPKDSAALAHLGKAVGLDLRVLGGARTANRVHQERLARMIRLLAKHREPGHCRAPGRPRVGVFGLTFKPGTADLRDSPAVAICRLLAADGVQVQAYDPAAAWPPEGPPRELHLVANPDSAARDADVLALLTGWPEFRRLDWPALSGLADSACLVDIPGCLTGLELADAGICYHTLGHRRIHRDGPSSELLPIPDEHGGTAMATYRVITPDGDVAQTAQIESADEAHAWFVDVCHGGTELGWRMEVDEDGEWAFFENSDESS